MTWHALTFGNNGPTPFLINREGKVKNENKQRYLKNLTRNEAIERWVRYGSHSLEYADDPESNEYRRQQEDPNLLVEPFVTLLRENEDGTFQPGELVPANPPYVKWLYRRQLPETKAFGIAEFKAGESPQVIVTGDFPPEDLPLFGNIDSDWYFITGTSDGYIYWSVFHGPSVAKFIFDKASKT